MKHGYCRRTLITLTLLAGLLATGCTADIVNAAARSSLTSFVTNITSQTVRAVLNL